MTRSPSVPTEEFLITPDRKRVDPLPIRGSLRTTLLTLKEFTGAKKVLAQNGREEEKMKPPSAPD